MVDTYCTLPSHNPFNEIIAAPYTLRPKLDTIASEANKKLYLLELKAYIKQYARMRGTKLLVTTTEDGIVDFEVTRLLESIEAEFQLCEERIKLNGLLPSPPPVHIEDSQSEKSGDTKPSLYGSPREVARFMFAAEKSGLLPKGISPEEVAAFFGIKASSYSVERSTLQGKNYTPSKLRIIRSFLEAWLTNMSNDDIDSVIATLRKLRA